MKSIFLLVLASLVCDRAPVLTEALPTIGVFTATISHSDPWESSES